MSMQRRVQFTFYGLFLVTLVAIIVHRLNDHAIAKTGADSCEEPKTTAINQPTAIPPQAIQQKTSRH